MHACVVFQVWDAGKWVCSCSIAIVVVIGVRVSELVHLLQHHGTEERKGLHCVVQGVACNIAPSCYLAVLRLTSCDFLEPLYVYGLGLFHETTSGELVGWERREDAVR